MGTWGIARDMAKLNEENLKKLSRKGMFQKLKERGLKSKKVYRFKQATPETLRAIKQKMQLQNLAIRRRNIGIGVFSLTIVITIILTLSLIRF